MTSLKKRLPKVATPDTSQLTKISAHILSIVFFTTLLSNDLVQFIKSQAQTISYVGQMALYLQSIKQRFIGGIMVNALKIPVSEFDHYSGQLNAPVTLLEYGDFECPYCRAVAPAIEKLMNEFDNEICFVFRHFPMKNIHPHAELAALASEAADKQNCFWEMHHLLYRSDEILNIQNIGLLAQSIGLNMDEFIEDFDKSEHLEKINLHFKGGLRSGVSSTPTFFLNGLYFNESSSYVPLKDAIVEILNNQENAYYT